jgi:hypothetical protein
MRIRLSAFGRVGRCAGAGDCASATPVADANSNAAKMRGTDMMELLLTKWTRAILALLRAACRLTLRRAAALAVVALTGCGNPAEHAVTANPPVADPAAIPRAPALALVLSSGGPRGFAHIGVLKVLKRPACAPTSSSAPRRAPW